MRKKTIQLLTLLPLFLLLFNSEAVAQKQWKTVHIANDIALDFPGEPQETEYGSTQNWVVLYDSTLFQLAKLQVTEDKKSNPESCKEIFQGVVDQAKGTILIEEPVKLKGYHAIRFTVKPTAEPLTQALMKGTILDKDGRFYLLMVTTEKKDFTLVDRFLSSFTVL